MIVSALPIRFVDLIGSFCSIVFAVTALRLAILLRNRDKTNVIGLYLFWVALALTVFAISRSAGHILKQLLVMSGGGSAWSAIAPYSGAINTLMLILVGSVTLFFDRAWEIYRQITSDRTALRAAHKELSYFNRNLEERVAERTLALARSEEKFRGILEVSLDILLETTADGTIREISASGHSLFGEKPSAQTIGDRFADPAVWEEIRTSALAGNPVSSMAATLWNQQGNRIRTLISARRGDRDSSAPVLHLLVKDIENRLLLEEQVAHADKLSSIGQLSAGVAHEINNPLGIILGYTQLFLRHEPAGTQQYQDLKVIEKHTKHCKEIVQDLLHFARSAEPVRTKTDLRPLVEEALPLVRLESDTIRIDTTFDDTIPPLHLDPGKIRQVIVNLLINAAQAIGEKDGTIFIRTETADNHAILRIRDTGSGIPETNLPQVFDPFFTTKPTGIGTGLGLSVSFGIVEKHGGHIDVTSQQGKGSEFTVRLPLDTNEPHEISDVL